MRRLALLAAVGVFAMMSGVALAPSAWAHDPPKEQQAVTDAFQAAIPQYDAAPDGAKKTAIANALKKQVDVLLKDGMKNWVGTPVALEKTPEGDYWVSLDVGPGILAGTQASRAKDAATKTLIPQDSPMALELKSLKPGQQLQFDGQFLGYNNSAEAGRVAAPNLLTRFTRMTALALPPPRTGR